MNDYEKRHVERRMQAIEREMAGIKEILSGRARICPECGNGLTDFMHEKDCPALNRERDEFIKEGQPA